MTAALSTFAPIYLLAFLGWGAARGGVLGPDGARSLNLFVFHLAMPATVFLATANAPVTELLRSREVSIFAISTVIVMVVGYALARRFDPRNSATWTMAAGHTNSANLGIPVAVLVVGDALVQIQALMFQVLVVMPIMLDLFAQNARSRGEGAAQMSRWGRLRHVASNPIAATALAGVAVSATGFALPASITGTVETLGSATAAVALVCLGASLHRHPTADAPEQTAPPAHRGLLAAVVVLKLLAHPLLALGLAFCLGWAHINLLALGVCAALPSAQVVYILAQKYEVGACIATRCVLWTTLGSMLTLTAWFAITV